MLNYKGYTGRVEYDDEAKIFHGEIIDTKDVITFQGTSVDEIEKAFADYRNGTFLEPTPSDTENNITH